MVSNLPEEQKQNWVNNEIVMPEHTNSWGRSINKLTNAIPLYSANGNFYNIQSFSNNVVNLSSIAYDDGSQNQTVDDYVDGMCVIFKANFSNTGHCYVNINNMGNRQIKSQNGSNLKLGDIVSGNFIQLRYDLSQDTFYIDTANAADKNLSNLTETGEKHFLNKTQITNCLLEVPQTINLEIVNGELVLKKGSTFILPNGTNNFERVTTTEDLKRAVFGSTTTDMLIQIYRSNSTGGDGLSFVRPDLVVCSKEQPETGKMWYDLTNNKIYNVSSSGLEDALRSFPFAIVSLKEGVPIEIKQVFNGVGYFGNTIFADKGIKGLIPNGRNEDGTLKNTEFTTARVLTYTVDSATGEYYISVNSTSISRLNQKSWHYDETENLIYSTDKTQTAIRAMVGTMNATAGVISNFNPKQPFRAVDYNEFKEKTTYLEENYLNKTQITNCLLEIPQNIKLELNNGIPTLKAGSKVIIPNGFEADGTTPKFDYQVIEEDKDATLAGNHEWLGFIGSNGAFVSRQIQYCYSGTSDPASVRSAYYITNSNILNYYYANGNKVTASFPFCKFTTVDGKVTSIDQVFNGFGHIGSTMFADKGIKGLIPNGRNEDGTLNNIEFETQSVLTRTITNDGSVDGFIGLKSNNIIAYTKLSTRYYDEDENYFFNGANTLDIIVAGDFKTTSGVITEFQPKTAFRAVDYNEAVKRSELAEVHVVTQKYVSGTSWYRIWSDGWIEQGGKGTGVATISLLKAFSNTNYTIQITRLAQSENVPFARSIANGSFIVGWKIANQVIDANGVAFSWYACGY